MGASRQHGANPHRLVISTATGMRKKKRRRRKAAYRHAAGEVITARLIRNILIGLSLLCCSIGPATW